MGKTSLEVIWNKIVSETKSAQIMTGKHSGLVKNFLINDVYYRESAFAAKIFAVEYKRTNNSEYLERAQLSLNSLQTIFLDTDLTNGINEPTFSPRGIKYRKGSIPATIILIYAIEKASELINFNFKYDIYAVIKFLESCYLRNGRFYHDKIETHKKYPRIVNTTSMAYFFLEYSKIKGIRTNFYTKEIENIRNAILNSQRIDGFFPYVEPGVVQKIFYIFNRLYPAKLIRAYNIILRDNSIFFGDALHHLIVLYYYIVGCYYRNLDLSKKEIRLLNKGYKFIKNYLKEENDFIYFDFSWEPKPTHLRYCNFIDTSTYFYLLDFLRYMYKFNLISKEEKHRISNGILNHISKNLLRDSSPSINPYQGGEDFIHLIIPRPSESIFDKGFFLSDLMLEEANG